MKTALTIKKFKKIVDEITISDFTNINYFVGENGCGKSSILNAMSFLLDPTNSRHFFTAESKVEFKFDDKIHYLYWNTKNPNFVEHEGNLTPNIFMINPFNDIEKGANGISGKVKSSSLIQIGDPETLSKFNAFLEELDHPKLEGDGVRVNPTMIADGWRTLYHLKTNLQDWVKFLLKNDTINFIIIEEPENSLHPRSQIFHCTLPGSDIRQALHFLGEITGWIFRQA